MERYIYIFTNQFVLLQAHHRPSTSKFMFSNCDSGMTQTSPIAPVSSSPPPPQVTSPLIVSAVCWLVDSSQRDPSLRIVWSLPDQSSPGSSTKRGTSVQTSITAVSPWSRGKRSSLERTGGALVRREIPLYTRSRGARITSPPLAKPLSERRYGGKPCPENRNLRCDPRDQTCITMISINLSSNSFDEISCIVVAFTLFLIYWDVSKSSSMFFIDFKDLRS